MGLNYIGLSKLHLRNITFVWYVQDYFEYNHTECTNFVVQTYNTDILCYSQSLSIFKPYFKQTIICVVYIMC